MLRLSFPAIRFTFVSPAPPLDKVEPEQDLGDIQTSKGVIRLNKGTRQFLARADAENLIRRGLVKHVTTNEKQ